MTYGSVQNVNLFVPQGKYGGRGPIGLICRPDPSEVEFVPSFVPLLESKIRVIISV